jgi:hypothetical protein
VREKCGISSSNSIKPIIRQDNPIDEKAAKFSEIISSLLSASSSPQILPLFPTFILFPNRQLSILVNLMNLFYSLPSHPGRTFLSELKIE